MKTTKTKKLLSILLTIMLVVGMIPASVISAGATGTEPCESTTDCTGYYENGFCNVCDGYQPVADSDSDGYYEIGNAGQLYSFAELVNAGNTTINARLVDDIVVNEGVLDEDKNLVDSTEDFRVWNSIATESQPYNGDFDGNGKTISGLYQPVHSVENFYTGLFRTLGGSASVHELGVKDSYFFGYNAGSIAGKSNGCPITNCYSTSLVKGSNSAGGLVAELNSPIENCLFLGKVEGIEMPSSGADGAYVGAIAGKTNTLITNSHYLPGCATDSDGFVQNGTGYALTGSAKEDDLSATRPFTQEELESGRIWYYLQKANSEEVWYQDLKTGEFDTDYDEYPVLNGPKVYISSPCPSEYSNSEFEYDVPHTYVNGYCSFCNASVDLPVNPDGWYEIGNMAQLYAFAELVNAGNTDIKGRLTADITVNEKVFESTGTLVNENLLSKWTPIGNSSAKFTGEFDGNGKIISGLYCAIEDKSYIGLFGYLDNAEVYDVSVENSYFYGHLYIAGIAGYAINSNISKCYNMSTISCAGQDGAGIAGNASGTTITSCGNEGRIIGDHTVAGMVGYAGDVEISNCYNTGAIGNSDGSANDIGGIVGYDTSFTSTISNCSNSGKINGNSNVGGLGGNVNATFEKCFNSGYVSGKSYVGGLVGSTSGAINNCYNTGTVTGSNKYIGGLCGLKTYTRLISNCYNTGYISGDGAVGALVGEISSTVPVNCYYLETNIDAVGNEMYMPTSAESKTADEFASGEVAVLLQKNNSENVWGQDLKEDARDDKYDTSPVLGGKRVYATEPCASGYSNTPLTNTVKAHNFKNGFCEDCGVLDEPLLNSDSFYEIENAGQLYWFSMQVRHGDTDINGKLISDITVNEKVLSGDNLIADTSDLREWVPIGNTYNQFSGEFNGNGKLVSGLYIDRADLKYIGLFSYVKNADVYGITVYDSYISGDTYVGGLIGYSNYANISDCYNQSVVRGENAGGIVGSSNGNTQIKNCGNYGSISGNRYLGGIAGHSYVEISNCYNRGDVKALYTADSYAGGIVGNCYGKVTDCFNTGYISGTESSSCIGGIAGHVTTNNIVQRSYNAGYIYGSNRLGGIIGYNFGTALNCYNRGTVNGNYRTGGIVGENTSGGEVTNTHNIGNVNGSSTYIGAIVGENTSTINNSYYLENCAVVATYGSKPVYQKGVGVNTENSAGEDVAGQTASGTSSEFASGKIAYLLQSGNTDLTWGQRSNIEGTYPVLTSSELYRVVVLGDSEYSVCGIGDTNSDGLIDVSDYQELINAILDDGHEAAKQIGTANYGKLIKYDLVNDGYLDVLDAAAMALLINGLASTNTMYAVGDFDFDGKAYEISDLSAIKHAIGAPEKLSTAQKYACDINGDGKVDKSDLIEVTEVYGSIPDTNCNSNAKVIYRWSLDCSVCSATVICTICNKIIGTETVNTTSEQLSEVGCVTDGVVRYTAIFTNSLIPTKTKDIVTKATGHNFENGDCVCGAKRPEINVIGSSPVSVGWTDIAFGTTNSGVSPWKNGDQLLIIFKAEEIGTRIITVEYFDGDWLTDSGDFGYLVSKATEISAVYAPCYKAENNAIVLKDGMLSGTCEYIVANAEFTGTALDINFENAKSTYSRLRIVGEPGLTYTVSATSFTPAGPVGATAPESYTLTADQDGNMFIYGDFASGATFVVAKDGATYIEQTFGKASEDGKGYMLADWSGYIYDEGTNTYMVYTADALYSVAELVNGGQNDVNITLCDDIVLNDNVLKEDGSLNGDGSDFRSWSPIGYYSSAYSNLTYNGTFDGAGHTISGLYCNTPTTNYVGLFGNTSEDCVIKNVGLIDSYVYGKEEVGAIAGYARGVVENCYNTGYVYGRREVGGIAGKTIGTIKYCYNTGSVNNSENYYTAGIVGYNDGLVENCYNCGTINGLYCVGGISGYNSEIIESCYNTGDITGENNIAGVTAQNNYGKVYNCYNTGTITSTDVFGGYAGGIVSANSNASAIVENCYSIGNVVGNVDYIGGVVGSISAGSVTNCYYNNIVFTGNVCAGQTGGTLTASGKSTTEFASTDMATLLNADQENAPWEYLAGNPAPTLKAFNS